jgi:DNA-binding transcriptional ArsR family regulator
VLKIEIEESLEKLKQLLSEQKTGKSKERLQVLYWLSSGKSQNVEELAARTGHHRTTVSRWLSIYRKVGMTSLLNIKKSSGRIRKIDREIEKCLVEELKDPEGFISYGEVQQWLKGNCSRQLRCGIANGEERSVSKAKKPRLIK